MPTPLRLLLIEDSEDDALLLTRTLSRAGYTLNLLRVDTVAALQQALNEQDWDIIVSDYNLPQFNGLVALEIFKQKQLDIPYIIVSGAIGEEVAVAAMKAGVHDYVMKDKLARLAPAIERELREAEVRRQRRAAEEDVRRQNRELGLLNKIIAASVMHTEPDNILAIACQELAKTFNLPLVFATRLDLTNPTDHIALVVAAYGPPQHPSNFISVTNNPHYQHLITNKTPLVINGTAANPASLLLLPLIVEDQVTGSLNLESPEPREFTAVEVRLAESVAQQVSGALTRAQLDTARRLLTQAIEQSSENVIITDLLGRIVYVNPSFETTTGFTRAEVLGPNSVLAKNQNSDSAFYRKLWEIIDAGQTWQGRLTNLKKDGTEYTIEATINPVRNEQGTIVSFVSVQRDVTREIQLEAQYRQSQKMEAIGQLTAGIAHDFNNLLTAINGFASLLQIDLDPGSSHLEMVEKILESGQRAADLVRQLLVFSRKQVVRPQPLDLNVSVQNMHKILKRVIGEDIHLHLNLAHDLNWIKIDPIQIEQIVINLVVNGRDAMPNGGSLTISTANALLPSGHPALALDLKPGMYVKLTVADTGVGMTDDIKEHIFEPFFTTKEPGKGTGLGLATVFGIIKQSNGNILVHSQPNAGSKFEIYLPSANIAETADILPVTEPQPTVNHETILVVEDDTTVRDLVQVVLRKHGYTVLAAPNSQTALNLVAEYSGHIHLLLADIVMPGLNGKDLTDAAIQLRPGLKIMFMSGYNEVTLARHGILASNIELMPKPFSTKTLVQKIRIVLDS